MTFASSDFPFNGDFLVLKNFLGLGKLGSGVDRITDILIKPLTSLVMPTAREGFGSDVNHIRSRLYFKQKKELQANNSQRSHALRFIKPMHFAFFFLIIRIYSYTINVITFLALNPH